MEFVEFGGEFGGRDLCYEYSNCRYFFCCYNSPPLYGTTYTLTQSSVNFYILPLSPPAKKTNSMRGVRLYTRFADCKTQNTHTHKQHLSPRYPKIHPPIPIPISPIPLILTPLIPTHRITLCSFHSVPFHGIHKKHTTPPHIKYTYMHPTYQPTPSRRPLAPVLVLLCIYI